MSGHLTRCGCSGWGIEDTITQANVRITAASSKTPYHTVVISYIVVQYHASTAPSLLSLRVCKPSILHQYYHPPSRLRSSLADALIAESSLCPPHYIPIHRHPPLPFQWPIPFQRCWPTFRPTALTFNKSSTTAMAPSVQVKTYQSLSAAPRSTSRTASAPLPTTYCKSVESSPRIWTGRGSSWSSWGIRWLRRRCRCIHRPHSSVTTTPPHSPLPSFCLLAPTRWQ